MVNVTLSPLRPETAEGCAQSQTPARRQSPELVTVISSVAPSVPARIVSAEMAMVPPSPLSDSASSSEQPLRAQAIATNAKNIFFIKFVPF